MILTAPDILQTKLAIPQARADLIGRTRLVEQLDQGLNQSLTLISAPAGFGKTTLLSEWLASSGDSPVAWVSLDEDDNDPARFLMYLVYALVRFNNIVSDEVLPLLQTSQPPPPKVILTALIRHLEAIPNRFVLALDDYHLITARPVHDAMIFLLEHLPVSMRLVLISREDPPLPLARLRGQGRLAEIRADDLRFTPAEAGQFLLEMLGVTLSAEQVHDLDTRTEGWIAGLQLAALAMKGRDDISGFIAAFTGSHRFVLDYLTEEVLSRQPEDIQQFLLETSILDRLCGPLCDTITGRTDGQAILEQIERGNLFLIPLDDQRYWYRYHHLFADVLQNALKRGRSAAPDDLHRRACSWFEQNGWIAEAVEHAFAGHDVEQAALLVENYGERLWMRGELATVLRWMRLLPESQIQAHPRLGLTYAFILTLIDEIPLAELHVAAVEQMLLQQTQPLDEASHKALLGQAAVVRATVSELLGEPGDTAITSGLQALEHLPEYDLHWRAWANSMVGNAYFTANGDVGAAEAYLKNAMRLSDQVSDQFTSMIAVSRLTRMYIVQGKLRQAAVLNSEQLRRELPLTAYAQVQLDHSLLLYEFNDLAAAMDEARAARETFEGYLLNRFQIDGCVIMARLKWTQGEIKEAEQLVQQAVDAARTTGIRQSFVSEGAWQAWLWLKIGKLDHAAQWALAIEPTTAEDLDPAQEFEHITLARVQIAQGRLVEAEDLLARLFTAADHAGRIGRIIVIAALQAQVASLCGQPTTAMTALSLALQLAEPEGYVRTFVDEGAIMQALLRTAKDHGMAAAYVTRLLDAFDHSASVNAASPEPGTASEFEPLSERELEVLALIADGASNREIAEALFVSVGTVKKHLNNMFLKLDAHSRTEAIAIARQHNLL